MPVMDVCALQRLEQRVLPAQLLLAELVALPCAGLAGRLDAELDGNPALELPAPPSCDGCGLPRWRGRCSWCRGRQPGGPDHLASIAAIPATTGSRARLLGDAVVAVRPQDRPIAAYLVEDVDQHGLLTEPLSTVAGRLSCSVERVRRVIEALRRAGLPGLCATTLAERLALQAVDAARDTTLPEEVRRLIGHGLDALADGRPPPELTTREVALALAWLRRHVAVDMFEPEEGPVPPAADVLVWRSRQSGGYVVETIPGPWSAVRVAPSYREFADRPEVRPAITRATRFVEALEHRDDVLTRVCSVVVRHQAARLESGPRAHRALSRRDVAVTLGLHESTVSRAVAGKHILLPSGEVAPLSTLFGAADTVQQCLVDLVSRESVPRSDAELVRALARHGHVVARRTIAKYRAELGIPRHRNRKGGDECDSTPGPVVSTGSSSRSSAR